MGRTLTFTIHSASNLTTSDGEELAGEPFLIVCFDGEVSRELGRTEPASDMSNPEWEHTFDTDVTSQIETIVEETGSEPDRLTFCVYDGDETEREAIGQASLDLSDLLKSGGYEGDLELSGGNGTVNVAVEMRKARVSSMMTENAALKIAGGVAGAAALGALGTYLYKKHQKKKQQLEDDEGVDDTRTGVAYGAPNFNDVDDDEEDEDIRKGVKPWYEMDDVQDDDDDEERWADDEDENRWGDFSADY